MTALVEGLKADLGQSTEPDAVVSGGDENGVKEAKAGIVDLNTREKAASQREIWGDLLRANWGT